MPRADSCPVRSAGEDSPAGRPGDHKPEPTPPPRPALSRLRQAFRFLADPPGFLAETRKECGDLFLLDLPGAGPMAVLCSADLLQEVFRMPEEQVAAGEIRGRFVGALVGDRGSVSLDGSDYLAWRRVLAPRFSSRKAALQAPAIRRSVEDRIARWPLAEPFRLDRDLDAVSVRTVARVLFGPLEQGSNEALLRLSQRFLETLRPPAIAVPPQRINLGRLTAWGRFVAARKALYAALGGEIRARKAEPIPDADDLMSELLAAGLKADPDEEREAVVHEMSGLLIGGGETTATVLAWTCAGLLSHRAALGRLRAELDRVLGGRPIEASDLERLPYLDAVIDEGIRYQSPAPFSAPRLTREPIVVGGHTIPAGTILSPCLAEVNRSEVFPHPDRFEPDNFFGREVPPSRWIPFGGGLRSCLGRGLARLELAVVVATIVQRADLELAPGSLRPARSGIGLRPEDGVRVVRRA